MKYGKVTPSVITTLKAICGAENILETEGIEDYSHDEGPHGLTHSPDVVVKPPTSQEVSAVMNLANEKKIPITPRGASTGLSGGSIPILGGISLSLERLKNIIEIDTDNFCVTAEAGVTIAELCTAVQEKGLYYPVYPGETSATIGGNVATNAGGMRAVKYGVTRNFVLGLEAVLPSGEIIFTGGKYVKSSTAYDLTQLLIGSEGTLAVITKVTMKLITPPGSREILLVPFPSLSEAIKCVPVILKENILPVSIEFMEKDILDMVRENTGKDFPISGYPAYLLMMIESENNDEFTKILERISKLCLDNKAVDVFVPASESAKRNLLDIREKFYPTLQKLGMQEMADVVVPRSRIADFTENVRQISLRHNIKTVAYGHAGDGNVHLHFLPDSIGAKINPQPILKEIYESGIAMGGTISGEHGIGFDKKDFLRLTYPAEMLALMKRIKVSFDPHNILNPGKIFD